MYKRRPQPAFTLIELVLVMLIIAIMAGILAPSLGRFSAGRAVDNFGRQIVGLAQYARAQSISESRVYRLNFDQTGGQIWLTADSGSGNFNPPTGDLNHHFTAPDGVKMQIVQNNNAPASPVLQVPWPATVQPQPFTQPTQLLDGTSAGNGSILAFPPSATFVQFQPTGRTDPTTILLSDYSGHSVKVSCPSPDDMFREVTQ